MYTISYFKIIDYTKDGRRVNGVIFNLIDLEETHEKDAFGRPTLEIYLSADKISGEVSVGAVCELCYSVVRGKPLITGIKIS